MPPLAAALLTVTGFAGGAWLTLLGAVLTIDALAAFEVNDARAGLRAARAGIAAAWIGLPSFVAAAIAAARVLA